MAAGGGGARAALGGSVLLLSFLVGKGVKTSWVEELHYSDQEEVEEHVG